MTTTVTPGIPRQSATTVTRSALELPQRPPTQYARQAPPYLIQEGYDLARNAIGYRLENVGFDDAVSRLLEEPREEALRIAEAYLAFTDLDAPRDAQIDALFLVENALFRLQDERTRGGWRRLLPRRHVR